MKKIEAQLTTIWIKWARINLHCNFIAEVKWCPKGKFYFSSGSFPKEVRILRMASRGPLVNKQSDIAMLGTLCDVWGLYEAYAVVPLFFDKTKCYNFSIQTIDKLMKKQKSITEDEAKAYADEIVILK